VDGLYLRLIEGSVALLFSHFDWIYLELASARYKITIVTEPFLDTFGLQNEFGDGKI
jgi:hypothetical protein